MPMSFFKKMSSADLLSTLSSPNEKAREKAKEQIIKHKFSTEDLPLIYKAISKPYHDDLAPSGSTKSDLLHLLWELHDQYTIVFLKDIYPSLIDNPDTQFYALRALSQINTTESLRLFLDILLEQKPRLKSYTIQSLFIPLYESAEHAGLVFPKLFDLLEDSIYKYSVYHLALHYRDNLEDFLFNSIKEQVLRDFEAALSNRTLYESGSEEYDDAIDILEITLDVMGSIPEDSTVSNSLRCSVRDPIPRISLYASLSLIRLNEHVPEEVLHRLAADPQTRLHLYEALDHMERADLFPSAFLTQLHLAEADMVEWLSHPNEFNRPPDEIELIESRDMNINGKIGRLYLFKYFYHDDPDGWMVGISGPFPLDNDNPSITEEVSLTFSHFNKLEKMNIEEHFKSFLH